MADRNVLGTGLARLVLLVPFAASLVAHAFAPVPAPFATPAARPSLAFSQYMVDLGTIAPTDEAAARFRFRNMGDAPVTLKEPETSCGCLKPVLAKKTLDPGEVSEMIVRIRTASAEPGSKEYTIKLPYEDEKPRTANLVFRVTLPPKQVLIRPKALIFYQLSGQATEQVIEVIDQRPESLEVLAADSTSPLAEVELLGAAVTEDDQPVQRIKVRVTGQVPPGRHNALIRVRTSDDVYRHLMVPLVIEGPVSQVAKKPSDLE